MNPAVELHGVTRQPGPIKQTQTPAEVNIEEIKTGEFLKL
jgi:hypothetical protein